jgi:fumarate reductase flavoprotein subunit
MPEVVIVGAGTAGIPAAIEAADAGARVVLVEKQSRVGGMLHISTGQFSGAGTRRQRERGIQDTAECHLADVERLSHGLANPDLVRESVLRQGGTVDWLQDLGFDFLPDSPRLVFGHELYSVPRTFQGKQDGRSILRIFQRELHKRVARGQIELRLATRLRSLIRNARGDVTGVHVVGPDGDEQLETRAVVLATGGYAANRDLVRRFLPADFREALTGCLDHATGDGLLVAEEAGAATTASRTYLPTMSLIPDPERPGFTLAYGAARLALVPAYRPPHEIWVNTRGERWVREDTPSPERREQALLRQPELKMAVIWDARALEVADPLLQPLDQGWTRERIQLEAERGHFIWAAPSLAELADRMGIRADGLERTVARYNAAVDERHDPDFGRQFLPARLEQPPFYGVWSQAAMLMSREGLRVNPGLSVLDATGTPIRGLYAVGEILGASQFMGDSFVGGMSVGPCMTLGRYIGQQAARVPSVRGAAR